MEDLVRSSRWGAWVMGSLACPFWGKILLTVCKYPELVVKLVVKLLKREISSFFH